MLFVAAYKAKFFDIADSYMHVIEQQCQSAGRKVVYNLTYEDIVLNNPISDIRTFTIDETSISESSFYHGHKIIEDYTGKAIELIVDSIETKNPEALIVIDDLLNKSLRIMRSFVNGLNRSHFIAFKPFFETNEMTKEKGPSGAFSAKMQHIDILVSGVNETLPQIQYLLENEKYFPKHDFDLAIKTIEKRQSLVSIFRNHPDAKNIAQKILQFRHAHFAAVVKHIGKEVIGSAEADEAKQLLLSRIDASSSRVNQLKMSI